MYSNARMIFDGKNPTVETMDGRIIATIKRVTLEFTHDTYTAKVEYLTDRYQPFYPSLTCVAEFPIQQPMTVELRLPDVVVNKDANDAE